MTFGERVVGALTLDANTFEDIERDPSALGQAVGVIVLAAISAGIGNIWYGGLTGIVSGVIPSLIGYLVWAAIVWLVGTKVMPDPTTHADFPEAFRVIGFAAAPGLLGIVTIVPILGWVLMIVLWLWSVAAMVVAVKATLDYQATSKAVVVVLIGFVGNLIVWGTLTVMMFGAAAMSGALGY